MPPQPSANERWRATRAAQRQRRRTSRVLVALLTVASAVGGARAGVHPTGTPIVDPLYGGVLAGLVTFPCSQAKRWSWLVLSAAAVVMSRAWLLLPAFGALGAAVASVFPPRRRQRVGALVGALAIQVVLRWPPVVFHGFTAIVALAAILPCLVSAYVNAGNRWRRRVRWTVGAGGVLGVLLGAPLVAGAALARAPVAQGVSEAQGALDAVSNGGGSVANTRLSAASRDFAVAHRRAGAWWTAGAYLIPVEAQQRRALARATSAGDAVTRVAAQVSGPLSELRSSFHGGQLDLARIAALSAPVHRLDKQLAAAQVELASTRSPWLIGPIQSRVTRLGGELDRAESTANLADQVVPVLPGLLGGDGPRHYFIAFMTPSESRGLDGFIGSYGLLTADRGHLSLVKAGPIAQLINAAAPGARHLTGLSDYLARYGRYSPADHFQDLSYSPDFPTVAKAISQLYPQSGGQPVDGVMAIDPYGLAALLNLTGPISVPGLPEPLTASNAAQLLTVQQYVQFGLGPAQAPRHDLLQATLQIAFTKLAAITLPSPRALADKLDPSVREGRLLLWTVHPSEQPLLRRLGLDGAFPAAKGGDLLAVTTQNAANNKIDAYLHRRIDDQVTFDPGTGQVHATMTVTLTNDAPASGLPSVVIGSYPGSKLPPGTNYTWLSVYSPLRLGVATIAGARAPMTATPELGVTAYSVHLIVPPTDTVTLTLHFSGRVAAGRAYRLQLREQPTVNPDRESVEVTPTEGWTISGPSGGGVSSRWTAPRDELISTDKVRFRA